MNEGAGSSAREVHVLHRYWIWADALRLRFLDEQKRIGTFDPEAEESIHAMLYMSYWYGALYVVVEGWRSLKLQDDEVDVLLKSPDVGLLKRYRNGVFHFQRNYWDERLIGLIREGAASAVWIGALHDAFARVLLAILTRKRQM